jgi:predicted GIY-YIG superfamily endonuclease
MKNCTKPKIPDTDYLIEKAEELFSKISLNKMFMFSDFCELKNGKYCKNKSVKGEISGLYIFYKGNEPIYVGMSRKVISRIRQHMYGKTHYASTLTYLIVTDEIKPKTKEKRKKIYQENEKAIREVQREMREEWKIRIIEVDDPYVRYFSEIYFAAKLKTCWNYFETH